MANAETALNTTGATFSINILSSDPGASNLASAQVINVTTDITPSQPYGATVSYIPYLNSYFSIRLARPIILSQPDRFQACITAATFQPPISADGYISPVFIYSNIMSPSIIGSGSYNLLGIIPPPVAGSSASTSYPAVYTNTATVPLWLPLGVREISEIIIQMTDISGNLIPASAASVISQSVNTPPAVWTQPSFPDFAYSTNLTITIRRIAPDSY